MTFWLLVAVMLAAGLAAVLPALLRGSSPVSRHGLDEDLYRQRLEELEADVRDGAISADHAVATRQEIERTLLAEAEAPRAATEPRSGPERAVGFGLAAVLVPVIALAVYLKVGEPGLARPTPPRPAQQAAAGVHPSFDELVKKLEARLATEPDDAQGWEMLARTYLTLQNYPKAVAAIERVYQIVGEQPRVMLEYAEMLGMANGGSLQGRPAALIKRALVIEPDNIMGLWLAGISENEQGNLEVALEHWRRAKALAGDDAKTVAGLQSLIDQALARAGPPAGPALADAATGGGTSAAAAPTGAPAPAASNRAPGMDATPAPPAAPGGSSRIRVSVQLADHLRDRISPDDTVFVFARSLAGPPMPLAVVRRPAGELPFEVTLDETMAMTPALSLATVDEVRLVARISKSGTALPQSGDLEGEAAPVKVGADETIAISVSRVVP